MLSLTGSRLEKRKLPHKNFFLPRLIQADCDAIFLFALGTLKKSRWWLKRKILFYRIF